MNILFITAHPYLPQLYGGLQTSTEHLCHGLTKKGHKVSVLCGLTPHGYFGLKARIKTKLNKLLYGHKISRDMRAGYSVWRTWFPWDLVSHVTHIQNPDLIVVLAGEPVRMALAAKETQRPLLMQLQNVEFQLHGLPFEKLGNIPCIANSNFTAQRYRERYGVDPVVIYPFISHEKYRTTTSRKAVTFINPVPEKGCEIALEVARLCPNIPFTFVLGWPLTSEYKEKLQLKLAKLPNVTLLRSQSDMRIVYSSCKILMVPSLWEETYGMVVTEAQVSGIPVVASTKGGLPEAVGPGGVLIDPEGPIELWVTAIQRLWKDEPYYMSLAKEALDYSNRENIKDNYLIDSYEKIFQSIVSKTIST